MTGLRPRRSSRSGTPPAVAAALVLSLGLAACGPAPPSPTGSPASGPPSPTAGLATASPSALPLDLARPWRGAAPAAAEVDAAIVAAAETRAEKLGTIRSLVVVRHGTLVDERYFGGATRTTVADIRSGTKSVLSLLVGIASQDGTLGGPAERLDALLRPPVAVPAGPKAAITMDDLLTMRSGFEWDESTKAGYNAWVLAPNQVDYLLAKPLVDTPGTTFRYDTAAVHLLSVGLSQATGGTAETYARRSLLDPLGIGAVTWETDNQGFNNGGAGLSLLPTDYARIGQLVLQHGASGDRQVVPAAWLDQVLASHLTVGARVGPLEGLHYGYLWWLGSVGGRPVEFAWGYRGQFLFLVPSLDLVVVVTSVLDDPSIDPDTEAAGAMDLIVNGILPAVH